MHAPQPIPLPAVAPVATPNVQLLEVAARQAADVDETLVGLADLSQALRSCLKRLADEPLADENIAEPLEVLRGELAALQTQLADVETLVRLAGVR